MAAEKKIPEIRFKGFEGEWEEKKMSELTSLITKGTSPIIKNGNETINYVKIENIAASTGEISITTKITEEEHNGYLKRSQLKENDILFSIAGTLGRVAIINKDIIPANTNQALAIIRLKDGYLNYITTYLKGRAVSDFVKKNPTVGAQPNLSLLQVGNLDISYPPLPEQTQIGTYFQHLDSLISLHQRKYEKLLTVKKAMLEKMFPKEGADVPEIRFKGFEGKWKKKKLGDIGSVVTGSTPSTQNSSFYSEDGIPWVTPTDISENETFNTAKKISLEGQKVSRIVPKNTILVTCIASIGKNTLLGTKGSFNQQINGLVPNLDNYEPYFLFSNSYHWSLKMKKTAGAGTMLIVNKTGFSEIYTTIPSLPEQTKIGKFFQNLDTIITQHQKELAKLKNLKKACLEKMFV